MIAPNAAYRPLGTGRCSRCGSSHAVTKTPDGRILADACGTKRAVAKAPAASKYRATSTHVDGIRFASKTEAALYEWAKSLKYPIIVPHVRFPLHVLTSPGMAATWFTPDMLIADGEDVIEAWEAKGAKACESRDYALRARAFRMSYPSIPLRVFRKVGGEFVEDINANGQEV